MGWYLSKPVNQTVNMPDEFEDVEFNGTHGSILRAGKSTECALLIHGVRGNRTRMINRAKFLHEMGITSLSIDLQAHGETPGWEITFGLKESVDAANGMTYLRNNESCQKVVAIGQSLGGASALLGKGPINADALVLESVYPTIEEAVEDRLETRFGKLGRLAAPLLYEQIPMRINASLDELHPINAIKKVTVPVLIIGGTSDQSTKLDETQRMFDSATSEKELWLVDGAAHEDMFAFAPNAYKEKITDFLSKAKILQ